MVSAAFFFEKGQKVDSDEFSWSMFLDNDEFLNGFNDGLCDCAGMGSLQRAFLRNFLF